MSNPLGWELYQRKDRGPANRAGISLKNLFATIDAVSFKAMDRQPAKKIGTIWDGTPGHQGMSTTPKATATIADSLLR